MRTIRSAPFILIAAVFFAAGVYAQDPPAEAPAAEAPAAEAPAPEAPPAEAPAPEAPPAAPAEPPPAPALTDIRQVQIQVWISETNEQGLRDIGANLSYHRFVRGVEQSGSLQEANTNVFSPITDFDRVSLPVPDQTLFNPAGTTPPLRPDEVGGLGDGIQTRNGFGLTASVISPGYGTVDAAFRAVERKADADLISKPELLVANTVAASIKAGGQVPFQNVTYPKGTPQLSVEWKDIGVSLDLTPTILSNDFVELNIAQLEVTDISRFENSRGIDLPVFSKRSQTGIVQVPSSQTLVVGGLSSRVVRRTERRVPIVGKLPILGFPFRGRSTDADITHLLVFVSPTIVDLRNLTREGHNALNFWQQRGTEWENTERIETEVEAMQDEL